MFDSGVFRKYCLTILFKWTLGLLIALSFSLAAVAYLIDARKTRSGSPYLDYGGLLVPETNQMSITVDEFTNSNFLARVSLTIGRNDLLPKAAASDEIILIIYDVTSEVLTQRAHPLIRKSKSTNAALFDSIEKVKIPAQGNPSLYPFDSHLIAVLPMYMMNEIGFRLPDKAQMVLKLPSNLKVSALREIQIDRSSFKPVMSHQIDCRSGCGIRDNIFVFNVAYAWWYRLAVLGLLFCLFIPLFVMLKSKQLSTAAELLTLVLSIVAVRTFILGYQTGQLFILDFFFGAYFAAWMFAQLFRVK